jgi:NADH-quinone oxidoreductase subunit H
MTASNESMQSSIRPMSYAAGASLAAVLALSGLVAASKVPQEGYGLRMAGLLHTAADGAKMIFKEDFIPKNGDRLLHSIAPMLSLFPPLVILSVVPFGDTLCLKANGEGHLLFSNLLPSVVSRAGMCMDGATYADGSVAKAVGMQVADINIGILFIFAMAGTGVVGAALAGWASDNKYSLLGGLRAASQMVSYEVTLGLTAVGVFMTYNSLRFDDMVRWQGDNAWGIFVQPLAFFLFFAAATAESKRIPFDLPEGESEIVGYFTEYSGMKFGMFFFAEYIEVVTSSALLVTLFLGGWQLPFLHRDGLTIAIGDTLLLSYPMTHLSVIIIQVLAFFGKTTLMCLLQAVVRWTLPRFRYDQLMRLGWRSILPLSIANIAVTGIVVMGLQQTSPVIQNGLKVLGDLTQATVALASIIAIVALIRFLLKPAKKERRVVSTSAEIAASQGGTRTSPMQA